MALFNKPATERGEILFEVSITFVPIALLFVVFLVLGDWRRVLDHEEWLFVSAVLQAQALGKLFVASDHPSTCNRPLLYTIGIALVIGIVWCSLIVAKQVITSNNKQGDSQSHNFETSNPTGGAGNFEDKTNARLDKLEHEFSMLHAPTSQHWWNALQNIVAVIVGVTVFAWASQVERNTRKPA